MNILSLERYKLYCKVTKSFRACKIAQVRARPQRAEGGLAPAGPLEAAELQGRRRAERGLPGQPREPRGPADRLAAVPGAVLMMGGRRVIGGSGERDRYQPKK